MSQKNLIINSAGFIKHPVITIKRKLHPIIIGQMEERRNFELKVLNELPQIEGPALYLVTHATCHDAPITCEFIKEHFYILVGKQKLEFIDKVFFVTNGKIDVERNSKKSGKKATNKMVKLLSSDVKVVLYPEQTWCTKPSTPINHCKWGWVDILKQAQNKTGTTIPAIPIAIEYYDYTDNCCYINAGKPIVVHQNDSKNEKNTDLENTFATLKYEIWEQFETQKRLEVDPYLWKKIMQQRYAEYPKLDICQEKRNVFGWENDPEYVLNSPEYRKGIRKLEKIYKNY